jgi:hypothetical protein
MKRAAATSRAKIAMGWHLLEETIKRKSGSHLFLTAVAVGAAVWSVGYPDHALLEPFGFTLLVQRVFGSSASIVEAFDAPTLYS